ncbi:MAG: flagellar basal body-associated FliL family protein [bacterium]
MANDEDKTVVQSGDETEGGEGEAQSAKAGGSKKLILFGGIGAGAIILGIVLAIFVIKPMMSGSEGEGDGTETAQVEESDDHGKDQPSEKKKLEKPKKKPSRKQSSHGKDGENESGLYTVKDIVINPAGTGGTRFLSVSFAFELESSVVEAEFEAREAIIRDALITILSSKTVAQLTDAKQKEIVRYQIKKRVSELMKTKELAGVYYTDFVLQ